MLKDMVLDEEKCGEPMEVRTGACKFCGQTAIKRALMKWTDEEVDELVTETCECTEAEFYTARKRRKERAHNRIIFLFGEGNKFETVPERAEQLMHEIVEVIGDLEIQGATIKIGNGTKAEISMTTKDKIKVTRTKTEKSAYEE